VITGFNTDIKFQGKTYHVQTEDKGLETPLILSLVYDRGTILASKRSRYEDLIESGFDEKILNERLQKQHKLICAAIKVGRIEDLIKMTVKSSDSGKKVPNIENGLKPDAKPIQNVAKIDEKSEKAIPKPNLELIPNISDIQPSKNNDSSLTWKESLTIDEEMFFQDVEIIEVEEILSAEAVEIIPEITDEVLIHENPLTIKMLNESNFKGGERKTLTILVSNGEPVEKASVMVKILGSSFRPVIFHAKTDNNGIAVVHAQLPHFKTGRAAILVKASAEGEDVELRRSISQG
jgi:hypothetical protein